MTKPFVQWVGGKRQLLKDIKKYMPKKYGRYIEPFVGGGALFFELAPKVAIINDKNTDLIDSYKTIQKDPDKLISLLLSHKSANSKEYFLKIRQQDREFGYQNTDALTRAARFIYLNKTCYSALYRVNSKNQFNVPYGSYKNPTIFEKENILAVSQLLENTNIYNLDFATVISWAKKGDFVYLDPPYVPLSKTESFVSYTKDGFGIKEHLRLKSLIDDLTQKGVYVMLSNSASQWVYTTYQDYNIYTVKANRMINSKANKRSGFKEVIITNYPYHNI